MNKSVSTRRQMTKDSLVDAIAVFLAFILTASFFYVQGSRILENEARTKFTRMVSMASMQFNGDNLEKIAESLDANDPYYREAVRRLKLIRATSSSIRFAYIMARTDDPMTLVFLADADEFSTTEELDENGDGVVEEDEEPSVLGDEYDISEVPTMQDKAFRVPSMDPEPTTDQWGTVISAYAPILDSKGDVAAIVGIDIEADVFAAFNSKIFGRTYLYFAIAAGFVFSLYIFFVLKRGD